MIVLNLDELRQAAPKAVSDIVYMLTGGQGKARGVLRQAKTVIPSNSV